MGGRNPPVKEVVGLVPAAGLAERMGPLPCSKEILPIGTWNRGGACRVKVATHALLDAMRTGGAGRAVVILREGKEDVSAFLGDGAEVGFALEYVFIGPTPGPPFTLDRARPRVGDARVIFGFPDILFAPTDAFAALLERQTATGAEIILGLFPTRRPQRMDMVELDGRDRVLRIEIKPARTDLRYTWILAAWGPAFTEHLHEFVVQWGAAGEAGTVGPSHVGHAIAAALEAGLTVDSVTFPAGRCLDIGTPEDYMTALRHAGDVHSITAGEEAGA